MTIKLQDQDQDANDPHGSAARARIHSLRRDIRQLTDALELSAIAPHRQAITMILLADAALECAANRLSDAIHTKREQWNERQRAALEFLEVRTSASGRHFLVTKQIDESWPGLPPAGSIFRFSLRRAPDMDLAGWSIGRGMLAELETRRVDDGTFAPHGTMTLQALRQAFEDRSVVEAVDVTAAVENLDRIVAGELETNGGARGE